MTLDYDARLAIRGTGDPVVLVPGMDGTGDLFYRQLPLLERGYRVATYALRNDARSMDVLAADLAQVIDHMAPESRRSLVVGESFGGAVALTCALAHPDRVSGLVVLNSFPYFAPQIRLRIARLGLSLLPWGAMAVIRRATAFRLHSRHTHRSEVREFIARTTAASRQGYLNRLELLERYDVRERLRELGVPTLFLAASEDHLVPSVEQARYMAGRVPHAVLRILDGHGHICLIARDVDLRAILHEWSCA